MTGTAPTPAPAPPPAEYHCRRCGSLVGQECAEGLRLGGALLTRRADIVCAACGRRWVWFGEKTVAGPVDNPPPAPAPAEYRCRCGRPLGAVSPDGRLVLGGVILYNSGVRLQCPGCGEVRRYAVPPAYRRSGPC